VKHPSDQPQIASHVNETVKIFVIDFR
jgi:hypothetical protein